MKHFSNKPHILIVGGGHAGIEAALAVSRMGKKCCIITMDPKALGRMSCNPAIGGLAKGQMVREIDVFGGIMGIGADVAGLQFKILNRSKGKSVWSPRAQVDKRLYEQYVNEAISKDQKITLLEGEVVRLIIKNNALGGVLLRSGKKIYARSVILTCGTFLNGLVHIGERKIRAGRMGEQGADGITEFLVSLGFSCGRLKTGTPPRLIADTVNWEKLEVSSGDRNPTPFSYSSSDFNPPNIPCYTAQTSPECHEIIRENLFLSPMFSGDVSGVGPRYCPSIEDKIHRFSHRDSHTLFLEPEWRNSNQIYTNGFSTSLPEKIQLKALRRVAGLEQVEFYRPGYAIEYDFFPPSQLKASLESKDLPGLFFAGQINGTSGYEEAAAQGLIAGANSANFVTSRNPLILGRDEAYIGVLIDDLVTKDTLEPYRMFTSRAEHRLVLRYTNANRRLANKSLECGLIDESKYVVLAAQISATDKAIAECENSVIPDQVNQLIILSGNKPIDQKIPLKILLKRPFRSI